jgi:hypothetical protein
MKDSGTMNGGALQTNLATQCKFPDGTRMAHAYLLYVDATYFLKAVQGFQSKGINVYAVSIQVRLLFVLARTPIFADDLTLAERAGERERLLSNLQDARELIPGPTEVLQLTYHDDKVNVMAQIGTQLRTLLNNNGFSGVKVLGYDHNWSDAAGYPIQLVRIFISTGSNVKVANAL